MANTASEPRPPLVSIICRTVGRAELGEALASAAAQTHAPLEIVLVDAAARGEAAYQQACAGKPMSFALPDSPLSRPRAANFGLDHAQGDYLLLLDEDDWLAPDHVESLLAVLTGQNRIRAAYSSTRKTDVSGKAVLETFQQPFDRLLLMKDNYIPLHSMLFARELVEEGCRFDEAFEILEDWDFWLQLSERTDFHHVDHCTAFYREGGTSQTGGLADHLQRFDPEHRLGKARSAIYDKWLCQWGGARLNRLLGANQREWDQSSERIDDLGREIERLALAKQKAEGNSTGLQAELWRERQAHQDSCKKMEEERQRMQNERECMESEREQLQREHERKEREQERRHERIAMRLNSKIHDLQAANMHLHDTIRQLQAQLEEVFRSRSWQLTRPYRAIGKRLKAWSGSLPESHAPVAPDRSPAMPAVDPPERQAVDQADQAGQTEKANSTTQDSKVEQVKLAAEKPDESTSPAQRPVDHKSSFDQQAIKALDEFLASDETLTVPAETPVLSVLLVFFNQAHLSLACLQALLDNADVPFELIVVDNASTDRSSKLLDRLHNVKLVRNSANLGFVKAVNQGAKLANGEFLLLLNNDAFIEPGALGAALAALREEPSAGAVGGRIEMLDGKLQEAGSIIWRDGSCAGYGRGANPDDGAFQFRREVDYCSGAFLLFATARFRELGGFDEDFAPAYYEESDFCVRLRQQGLRIIYEPQARVRHYEFASTGSLAKAASLQERNRARFREKHAEFLQGQREAEPNRLVHGRTSNGLSNMLVIDDAVPHASLGSGYPRCRHVVSLLAGMPVNVTFYPLQFPVDDWQEVYRTLPGNVEVLLGSGRSGLAKLLIERAGFYRHVMVSRPTNMAFFNSVLQTLPRQARDFNIIYDAEAVFARRDMLWRELHDETIGEEERQRILSAEVKLADEASTIVAVSGAEAELFRCHGHETVVVLGHCLEPVADPAPFDGRQGLLFVGALKTEHSPNVDSLLWFASNSLPLIEREIPAIQLLVAGIVGAPSLVSIERHNIHFKGRLENLDEVYRNCRVFIAPTRFAAGIPHKVHEAAAHGIPAVVTPLLAGQLGWRHEHEVLVAASPEDFARQCLRLYRAADLWERLAANAQQAVREDCSEQRFRQTLASLIA